VIREMLLPEVQGKTVFPDLNGTGFFAVVATFFCEFD
jgi:hypothetical protein